MTKFLKYTAIAAVLAATAQSAYADTPVTKGGLTIKSDDGRFEATLGGRIHFDGALLNVDHKDVAAGNENSGFYFRRVFITLKGKAYGWMYNIDEDISNISGSTTTSTTTPTTTCTTVQGPPVVTTCTTSAVTIPVTAAGPGAGFNDVWLAKTFMENNTIYFGQHKPWRSLDEMASNNDTLFLERNALSANGLFGGRDYTQGIYYKYSANGLWIGASGYSQTKLGKGNTEGTGANVRVAYGLPIAGEGSILHVGVSYTADQVDLVASNPGFGSPTAGYSTSYSKSGAGFNVFSFANTAGASKSAKADSLTVETMGLVGPVFLQGEYGSTKFKRDGDASDGQKVDAFSVAASWVVFGGARTYKAGEASYGAVKVNGVDGAVEVAARYDNVKNKDNDKKISAVTLGANYYFNPNVRFMVDYSFADAEKTSGLVGTEAKPKALMARAQIAF